MLLAACTTCCCQAHANVSSHSDEFVVELLVSHDKLGLLVRELLAIEV